MSVEDQVIEFTIDLQNTGVAREGFGLGLIASHAANTIAGFHERFRLYNDVSGITGDGFPSDGPEVRAAKAVFAQTPHPTQVAIGRIVATVTMVYVINVAAVRTSFDYKLLVEGTGVTTTTVLYTSGVSDLNDDIAAGLVTQLNLVVGKNYTAAATGSALSKVVTVTGTAANDWFSIKVLDVTALGIAQTTTVANLDDELDAINQENNTWYRLITLYNSRTYINAARDWTETAGKTYVAQTSDSLCITHALSGADDVGSDYLANGAARTLLTYHPRPSAFCDAAIDGRLLPLDVGTWTEAFKTLVGPEITPLSPTQVQNLKDRRMGYYIMFGGRGSTFEGKVASLVYAWFDITVSVDWFKNEVQSRCAGLLLSRDKIGFTDEDIADVAGEARGAVELAMSEDHKVLARGTPGSLTDPPPQVAFPKVADIDPSTRSLRTLPNGLITGRFQGAVQTIKFKAVLSF